MEELKQNFPQGLEYRIVYDPTVFVRGSIEAVIHTLLEALALVVLVVIVFLQTWRASIIPPAGGADLHRWHFRSHVHVRLFINALSLFGLVLAIGIVVDDAIVVVENVERNIEEGRSPREATYQAMREVSGPIIAIALTLITVFVPIAFISGLTGEFYRQFALTIAFSTIISAFNSLTLSPALAALLLKSHDAPKDGLTKVMDRVLGGFFCRLQPRLSKPSSSRYGKGVTGILGRKSAALIVYAGLLGATYFGFQLVPPGFVPTQDKQYLVSFAQLPNGATLDRTEKVIRQMSDIAMQQPGVDHAVAFPRAFPSTALSTVLPPASCLLAAQAIRGAPLRRSVGGRHRAAIADEICRSEGSLYCRLPPAAGERHGHDRRLQAAGRGSHRSGL